MLPASVVPAFGQTRDARISGLRAAGIALVGRINTRGIRTLVATNQATADLLASFRRDVIVEPNILVAQEELPPEVHADERRDVVVAGLLIPRKRPWLAIDAMADPRLQGVRLLLVGDGPLRAQLQERAEAVGVSDRVSFLGRLSHAETLEVIARSKVLLHTAAREGAAWVVGEAASCGTLALVLGDSGAGSTAVLSANGSRVLTPTGDIVQTISDNLVDALDLPTPRRSQRWQSGRLDGLLDTWWT
jgi:glycosyltransferase involved in cell wall biosynthesis